MAPIQIEQEYKIRYLRNSKLKPTDAYFVPVGSE